MPLVLADRVQQTGTANTTVSFTLTGAVAGFQSFAVVGNGNTTYYSSTDASGNWEVGLGTYSTTGPTLTRTTVYASSNSNLAVTFSGAVSVFVTYPSQTAIVGCAPTAISGYVLTANGAGVAPTWQAAGGVCCATPTVAGQVLGTTCSCNSRTALGFNAGLTNQGGGGVAIGTGAGATNQVNSSVAIGINAGAICQGFTFSFGEGRSVAIGQCAGYCSQGKQSVAVGLASGYGSQGEYAVAVGAFAGQYCQSNYAVAIGYSAGSFGQGCSSVAIGASSSSVSNSVAIGPGTSSVCSCQTHIGPIRNATTCFALYYCPCTREITYG